MKNAELQSYLQLQIAQTHKRLRGFTHDINDQPLFKRGIFSDLQKFIHDFLNRGNDPRIIAMPGLRGTGKTTLLAQLYLSLSHESATKLYLSVDEAVRRFNVTLWDVLENYEEILGQRLEELTAPLFLFLDEIHYDENWIMFLKTIYDRSKKVMVFCTGSSALLLRKQINADVARRVFFVDIYPVCFSEYMLLKHKKSSIPKLSDSLKEAMLFSNSAQDVFKKLKKEEESIKKYWIDIDPFEIRRYLKLGTFPFTLNSQNEVVAVSFIAQIMSKVIYTDIPQFYKFGIETLNKIDQVLYLISDTLCVSAIKLGETIGMKPDTLRLVLESLESSGLLFRIPPFGAHFAQVKKPSKYLFATPALRFAYLSSKESSGWMNNYSGGLFEDIVGMVMNRVLSPLSGSSMTYDAADGGADFVLSMVNQKIVMEVGMGKKGYQQVVQTAEKVKPKYSLVIANDELEFSETHRAVKIPLKYFLLI